MSDLPEPDRIPGAPHPRATRRIIGQDAAIDGFLTAWSSGKLHHGWMLTGPRGVGKATLAYAIARFVLATPPQQDDGLFGAPEPPTSLIIDPEHPVARRINAGSEPGLFVLRRGVDEKTKRARAVITVGEIRNLGGFFHLSAPDGGSRVVIIDAADDLNPSAANALLKLLEEPPAKVLMLLVTHQPAGLLPTIRSRVRELRLSPLGEAHMKDALDQTGTEIADPKALSILSAGSVGAALRIAGLDGLALYSELMAILSSLPDLDRPRALKLAEAAATRGAEARLDLLVSLIDTGLARLARTGVAGPPAPITAAEPDLLRRLSPDAVQGRRWAEAHHEIGARLRHGRAVNLDPATLILDTMLSIQKTAPR